MHFPCQTVNKLNKCARCGKTNHNESDCYYREQQRHTSGERGHISRVCRGKRKGNNERITTVKQKTFPKKKCVHHVNAKVMLNSNSSIATDTELAVHIVAQKGVMSHICVKLKNEGKIVEMEFDTGAAVCLNSDELYNAQVAHLPLCHTNILLMLCTGEVISPEGVIAVAVKMNKQKVKLLLYVVKGDSPPPIFGRVSKENSAELA